MPDEVTELMLTLRFKEAPLDLEVEMFYGFLFEDAWGWGTYIVRAHPEIKAVLKVKFEKDRIAFIRKYILKYRRAHQKTIQRRTAMYQRMWKKRESACYSALSKIIESNWPRDKTMTAFISLNPISPRFLKTWSFSIYFRSSRAMEVIVHEICHFLYFKKWREVFPNSNARTFDSPHLVWHLSELLAPIILNDPALRRILKRSASFYDEHRAIKIKGVSAPKYFARMYRNRDSFESFLREAYREIRKYEKRFRK